MKKVSILLIAIFTVILLSSCSMHLSKLLGGNTNTPQAKSTKTKKVKATHTPPSPASAPATPDAMSTPTPNATSTGYQPGSQQAKVVSMIAWANADSAALITQPMEPALRLHSL
jgi:hypothetical protein